MKAVSLARRIVFGVAASWTSKMLTICLNLTLTPVLFRSLGQEELGLWFLMVQGGVFVSLLHFGFVPTMIRRLALAKGKSGADPDTPLTDESRRAIADLIATATRVLLVLGFVALVTSWCLGYFFLGLLSLEADNVHRAWGAWTIMCVSYALTTWGAKWTSVLLGMGMVGSAVVIEMAISAATLGAQVLIALYGGGIVALALAASLGAMVNYIGTMLFVRWRCSQVFKIAGSWNTSLVRSMLWPAFLAWLTSLGAFLILRTDQFFIALFREPTDLPAYHAAYQIVSGLHALAVSISSVSAVFVSQLWSAGELARIRQLLKMNVQMGLTTMLCGVAFLIVAGDRLIELWLGTGHFVGYPVLLTFCLTLTLEAQHVIVVTSSRATEDEAFAPWALGAGCLNIALTWLLIGPLGLWGVALATCLAQLATNNWYGVYRGLRRLRTSVRLYAWTMAAPVLFVFLCALSCGWGIDWWLGGSAGPMRRVLLTSIAIGFVWALAQWLMVLNRGHRRGVLVFLGIASEE